MEKPMQLAKTRTQYGKNKKTQNIPESADRGNLMSLLRKQLRTSLVVEGELRRQLFRKTSTVVIQ
eukprot:4222570-Amphidinium_carterae.1